MNNENNNDFELPKKINDNENSQTISNESFEQGNSSIIQTSNGIDNNVQDRNNNPTNIENLTTKEPETISSNLDIQAKETSFTAENINPPADSKAETTNTSLGNETLESDLSYENNVLEPVIEDNQEVKLEKKLVIEEPIKAKKEKGNPVVGFIALLIILGIIVAAFYYFINQGIIKLPENIQLPFQSKTTTTTTITTTETINETPLNVELYGQYKETNNSICPDISTFLTLSSDNTFTFNYLKFNENDNICDNNEITGNFTEENGQIQLITQDGTVFYATTQISENARSISLNIDNIKVELKKVNE